MNKDELYRFVSEDLATELREANERCDKMHRRVQQSEARNREEFARGQRSRDAEVQALHQRIGELQSRVNGLSLRVLDLTSALPTPLSSYDAPMISGLSRGKPEWSAQGSTGDQPARTNAATK